MLHLRLLCGHRIDRVRIVTGCQCVQELIHALSSVLPVKKMEMKLMEGGKQWESRHTVWEAGALATDMPLATPLWLQELLPKARLVPPALSFPLSTSQVRAEPCVYNPPCRSRVAKCCSSSASSWALTALGCFIAGYMIHISGWQERAA